MTAHEDRTSRLLRQHCRNDKALVISLRDEAGELVAQITAATPQDAPGKAIFMLHRREQLCVGWTMRVEAPAPEVHSPLAPRETD
jgi:hypothetical protein